MGPLKEGTLVRMSENWQWCAAAVAPCLRSPCWAKPLRTENAKTGCDGAHVAFWNIVSGEEAQQQVLLLPLQMHDANE